MSQNKHQELAFELSKLLRSDGSIIAVAISSEPPPGVERLKGKSQLCALFGKVQREGSVFYTIAENHACGGGGYYLGLRENLPNTPERRSGEYLCTQLGAYRTPKAARVFTALAPKLPVGSIKVLTLGALDKVSFDPDVIVVICSVKAAFRLLQAWSYDTGIRPAGWSGPTCTEAITRPYLTGMINYCLPDSGTQTFLKPKPEEVLVGFPRQALPMLVKNLQDLENSLVYLRKERRLAH